MCSALLNNFSLLLASAKKARETPIEMSDEVVQILFGVLDGLQDETSQVCAWLSFLLLVTDRANSPTSGNPSIFNRPTAFAVVDSSLFLLGYPYSCNRRWVLRSRTRTHAWLMLVLFLLLVARIDY